MIRKSIQCTSPFLVAFALLFLYARPAAAQCPPDQPGKTSYTIPEYNAFQAAANEKDPSQKTKLLDEFTAKFPNSTLLCYVYRAYADVYIAQKNYPKALDYLDKFMGLGDKVALQDRLKGAYDHSLYLEAAYNPKDPNAKEMLTKGRDDALLGLKLLDQFPKPDNMSDAQFADQVKKPVAITLNSSAGFAALQMKDYKAAADSYSAAVKLNDTDEVAYYRLGVAYLLKEPPATMDGLWALARASALKGPVQAQAKDYLRKRILAYEQPGCDSSADAQVNEMVQLATNSAERPATYTLPSAADLDKIRTSSNILTVLSDLKSGGEKAKMTWLAICGAEFPEVVGKVIEVTPGTDSVQLKLYTGATPEEIQNATTSNLDVKIIGQPEASRIQKDDGVRFSGTLVAYDPDPAFMLHWDKAKVNAEDIPAEKGGAKHTPHKVPPKNQ